MPPARERSPAELLAAADRSPLAEVGYRQADGSWTAVALVPLVLGDRLTFALPYAQRPLAEEIAAAGQVLVVCSDARQALRGWQPAAGVGTVVLEADRSGERFAAGLLERELRKHPPSRPLADSPLLRREHWWYLPRLLLHLAVGGAWEVAARTSGREGVVFTDAPPGAHADTVAVDGAPGDDLRLTSLAGVPLRGDGEACLLRHDATLPDLEARSALVERGWRSGDRLTVARREGSIGLPPPLRLLDRYRAARAFERACRRELAGRGP